MKVIRFNGVLAAAFAAALCAPAVWAQNVAQVGGPAELPPAGFAGQQFVDSRGCVFMRAGFSGQTSWVPRIGRDRKPLCNEVTPAQAAERLASAQEPSAKQSAAQSQSQSQSQSRSLGAPMETVASKIAAGQKTGSFAPTLVPGLGAMGAGVAAPAQAQAPLAQVYANPKTGYAAAPAAAASVGRAATGCPASAPVLQQLPLNNGGSVAVCTRGDGSATGWVSPRFVSGARPGAAIRGMGGDKLGFAAPQGGGLIASQPAGRAQAMNAGQGAGAAVGEVSAYVAAWKDDRLNPNRGRGTAQGWADQAQIWTTTIPARTHADIAQGKVRTAITALLGNAVRVSGSSMSAPSAQSGATRQPAAQRQAANAAPQMGGRIYVQVGTFGQPSNAQNAAGRLAGLGLPVASAKGSKGGKTLVSIMAGPFASTADAQVALNAARQAGFVDAFLR